MSMHQPRPGLGPKIRTPPACSGEKAGGAIQSRPLHTRGIDRVASGAARIARPATMRQCGSRQNVPPKVLVGTVLAYSPLWNVASGRNLTVESEWGFPRA